MKRIVTTILLFIGFQVAAYAQFSSFQPLQKNFESTAFFGQPQNIIPNYYGDMAVSFLGAVNDPFLNLALNPALLPDKPHYIYAAFNTTQKKSTNFAPIYALYSVVPPYYDENKWNIAQPSATAAYLGRPFNNSNIFVGFAYQGLYFNDDYYLVPDNSYLNQPNSSALDAASVLPTDNADKMVQAGHFFTVWAGYEFNGASVGLKVNRSIFNRTGRSEQWYGYPGISPLAASDIIAVPPFEGVRSRNQNYAHWDVALGVSKKLSEKLSAGMSLGLVISEVSQGLNRNSGNLFALNQPPVTIANLDFYMGRNNSLTQGWKQSGNTWYGSLHGKYSFNENSNITFIYRSSRFVNDLSTESLNTEDFLRKYTYTYDDTVTNLASGHSFQSRIGDGEMNDTDHHLSLIMNMNFGDRVKTFFGVQFSYFKRGYNTSEQVNISRSEFRSSTFAPSGRVDSTRTQVSIIKDLRWKFDGYYRTFRFPVMLKIQATDWLGLDLGLSPVLTKHHYSDIIINDYQLNKRVVNGETNIRRDYIEKFNNKSTDYYFRMPAFFGVSVQPSDLFSFRLSASPVISQPDHGVYESSNWQGFINLVITP